MATPVGKSVWIGRVISGLIVLVLVLSGIGKLAMHGTPDLEKGLAEIQIPMSMIIALGILELGVALVYAFPPTAVMGAILVAGYMGGAMLTHWRVGQPFVGQTVIALLAWLGVWLREPRLKALLPRRRPPAA